MRFDAPSVFGAVALPHELTRQGVFVCDGRGELSEFVSCTFAKMDALRGEYFGGASDGA